MELSRLTPSPESLSTCQKRACNAADPNADKIAWYSQNSGNVIHTVAGKQANAWSLYDIAGNVWEWVADWYDESYYASSPEQTPPGPESGNYRVRRGGAWFDLDVYLRSAFRSWNFPTSSFSYIGFRCSRSRSP